MAGAPDGAVVFARNQTAGRGRRERQWESSTGKGVFASFILRPEWPASHAHVLAIVGALAAYRTLATAGVGSLALKWPNDVLAGGRKICGVLAEPVIAGSRIEFAVVGIGINVLQEQDDFSAALCGSSTSCKVEGAEASVEEVLSGLIDFMAAIRHDAPAVLEQAWLQAGGTLQRPGT